MVRKVIFSFLVISAVAVLPACKKEKKAVDPLSYLVIRDQIIKSEKIEKNRTQIISMSTKGDLTTLVLAFAMDSKIPEDVANDDRNAYAIRFTLQDSLLRSKRLRGGTFVLKFAKDRKGNLFIRNFRKTSTVAERVPAYSIDSFDTIVDPSLVEVDDTQTKKSILVGGGGTLTPIKPRVYQVTVLLKNIAGESWSIDHGYINEDEDTKEPKKIMNVTSIGVKVLFPQDGQSINNNSDLSKLGTV